MLKPKAFNYSKPLGIQIGSNNRGPCPPGQYTKYDADWALPDGQHGLPGLQAQSFNSLHAGVYRLYKTGLLKGNARGNSYGSLLDDPIHHPNVFGEASAGRLESGGASHLLIGEALCERFMLAVVALAAGNMMKQYNPVAALELAQARTHGGHDSGGFMAEDARCGMGARG